MKSVTMHNVDLRLKSEIRKKAKRDGKSLNKTIQSLLMEAFGLLPNQEWDKKKEFQDIFGIWKKEDRMGFSKRVKDLEKISPQN